MSFVENRSVLIEYRYAEMFHPEKRGALVAATPAGIVYSARPEERRR
jgi:hypothetical protein